MSSVIISLIIGMLLLFVVTELLDDMIKAVHRKRENKPAEDRNNVNTIKSFNSLFHTIKKYFSKYKATPLPPSQSPQGEIIFPPILPVPSKSHITLPLCNSAHNHILSMGDYSRSLDELFMGIDALREPTEFKGLDRKGMPDKKKPTATQGVNIEPPSLDLVAAGRTPESSDLVDAAIYGIKWSEDTTTFVYPKTPREAAHKMAHDLIDKCNGKNNTEKRDCFNWPCALMEFEDIKCDGRNKDCIMFYKKSPENCRICNEPLKEFPTIEGQYCPKCNYDNVPRTESFLGIDWGKNNE